MKKLDRVMLISAALGILVGVVGFVTSEALGSVMATEVFGLSDGIHCAAEIIYDEADLAENFASCAEIYAEQYGFVYDELQYTDYAFIAPGDSSKTSHYVFYYPLGNQGFKRSLADGNTLAYQNGWLISPGFRFYDFNRNNKMEEAIISAMAEDDGVGDDALAGVIFHIELPWSANFPQPSWRDKVGLELVIFRLKYDISLASLYEAASIMFLAAIILFGLALGCAVIDLIHSHRRTRA